MKTIYKYVIERDGIEMPKNAQIVHVGTHIDEFCIWAIVDTEADTETRYFDVVGTGHELASGVKYLDTVHQPPFVWHIVETNL